ncbi:restriction endonuclease subunit M [Corynebacterium sp. 13CS0277]|uniref:restriction endonuclease subunit M n=1 Tax=Corynebacterium sp. 13CS0277 TaxID=2071994 RepID=UPI000D03D099|nr:restriction endonuclease subunit M [Corynebacterium sp. 13CS0277]PRQ12422.1 restriction endonuclease subunit M [Corynebacterium sp. 13CS0277]
MAEYHAIANVDEFVSDYYLTSDDKKQTFLSQVTKRIKQWNDEETENGTQSPFARLLGARAQLQNKLAVLQEAADAGREEQIEETYSLTRRALGYSEKLHELTFEDNHGDLVLEFAASIDHGGLKNKALFITADVADSVEDIRRTPVRGTVTRDGKPVTGQDLRVQKVVGEMFLTDDQPEFIVIQAGRFIALAERETWPLGRFLAVDLLLALERNDTKVSGELRRVACILAAENIRRSAEGERWWSKVIEDSRNHSVKVSEDLRHAIRDSIEIIANDVLDRTRANARHKAQLEGLDYQGQKAAAQAAVDAIDVAELTKQCLRYLYRILFLLFAEASPELEILPVGVTEYDEGYSLTRLRNQILRPPATQRDQNGTYLYDSLQVLFDQVNGGYIADTSDDDPTEIGTTDEGLRFESLEADLFKYDKARYIEDVKLSNAAMHTVLTRLLMSKEQKGKDRGFISYATLGVTELGQVYEGLMSYSGRIATETLLEVAKNGNASKGSWLVEESIANADPETYSQEHFVTKVNETTGIAEAIRYQPGSFVYRQSARDRERSASFYTPKVLTSFTVGQAIEELKNAGHGETAADILDLKICEPAMGSGAFAVEAIRQLAEWYLDKAEEEAIEQGQPGIPAESRQQELQKVKAYIAIHNTYGVDLNATAVELGEIAIWLDTMTKGLKAPWFGLHLRRGNSLIGASHSVYNRRQVKGPGKAELDKMKERAALQGEKFTAPVSLHLKNPPKHIPLSGDEKRRDDEAYQFLLPAPTWGTAADAEEAKGLYDNEIQELSTWRNAMFAKMGRADAPDPLKTPAAIRVKGDLFDAAVNLSAQVDELWKYVQWRLETAEKQTQRQIDVWGNTADQPDHQIVTREQIEAFLHDEEGALRRIQLVMDIWCSFAFWPLAGQDLVVDGTKVTPPSRTDWYEAMFLLLGNQTRGDSLFTTDPTWNDIDEAERLALAFSGAQPVSSVIQRHPWIEVCKRIAAKQAFFHWELNFAHIFARGGFDLQVGNPPWFRPSTDADALLAEYDPWWILSHKPTEPEKQARLATTTADPLVAAYYSNGIAETQATRSWLGSSTNFAELAGQPDYYRAFMVRTWFNTEPKRGVSALIHTESHFTEAGAIALRKSAYQRLKRHFHFVNELKLFDIDNHVAYGIHVYGRVNPTPRFVNISNLYHPSTASASFFHDGSGDLPSFKDDNGNWDLRPHKDRIQVVDEEVVGGWGLTLSGHEEPTSSCMVYQTTSALSEVLAKMARTERMESLDLHYSPGWHETADRKRRIFEVGWNRPERWEDVILQGPHIDVLIMPFQEPRPTLKNNRDWELLTPEQRCHLIPACAYSPTGDGEQYRNKFTRLPNGEPMVNHPRVAWRRMASKTGYRTLIPALIPPGPTHVHTVVSCAHNAGDMSELLLVLGVASSLLADFFVRSTIGSDILPSTFRKIPIGNRLFSKEIVERVIALSGRSFTSNSVDQNRLELNSQFPTVALERAEFTREQCRLDALIARRFDIEPEVLIQCYESAFPVLRKKDARLGIDRSTQLAEAYQWTLRLEKA